jgi:hypothetical protein
LYLDDFLLLLLNGSVDNEGCALSLLLRDLNGRKNVANIKACSQKMYANVRKK